MLTRSAKSAEPANPTNSLFVLTGGPGSGKSTLMETLAAKGITTMPESGRTVIREQVEAGGTALPWADRSAFAQLMFERDLHSYHQALRLSTPVLFDRGLPDIAGYLRLCELPVPEAMMREIHARRYNRRVFIAPPWREIFTQDEERKQSFAEATATYEALSQIYAEMDYELVLLPTASVEERVEFVLREMST